MSIYCTDDRKLQSVDDLSKLYFLDNNGDLYYRVMNSGKNVLGSTLTRCSDSIQFMISSLNLTKVITPDNSYVYTFATELSILPSYVLEGAYYSYNVGFPSPPSHNYTGELVFWYYNTDDQLFIENCQCQKNGTNASMCGDVYGELTPGLDCKLVVNTKPTSLPSKPINNPDAVKHAIAGWVWTVFIVIVIVIVIAIVFMFMVIYLTYKSGKTVVDDISEIDPPGPQGPSGPPVRPIPPTYSGQPVYPRGEYPPPPQYRDLNTMTSYQNTPSFSERISTLEEGVYKY